MPRNRYGHLRILIDNQEIETNRFPDGTPLIKYKPIGDCEITYRYDPSKNELMDLYYFLSNVRIFT